MLAGIPVALVVKLTESEAVPQQGIQALLVEGVAGVLFPFLTDPGLGREAVLAEAPDHFGDGLDPREVLEGNDSTRPEFRPGNYTILTDATDSGRLERVLRSPLAALFGMASKKLPQSP